VRCFGLTRAQDKASYKGWQSPPAPVACMGCVTGKKSLPARTARPPSWNAVREQSSCMQRCGGEMVATLICGAEEMDDLDR
jgi:hypothetical protein